MSMNFIGRMLYPNQPAWQARRQAKQIVAAFTVAVLFGLVVGAIILFVNSKR